MKPHHWRKTMFLCLFILFEFIDFWFLIVLLLFDFWDDFWVSLVISGYKWWFEVVSFNWLLEFYLSKRWVFIVFRSTGTFDDLMKNQVSIVICSLNGYNGWFGGTHGIFCDLCKERIHWMIQIIFEAKYSIPKICMVRTSNRYRWTWKYVAMIWWVWILEP